MLDEEQWGIIELDVAQYFSAFFFLPWEDLGIISLEDTPVHQLSVTFPLGRRAIYGIDPESSLPVRVDFPGLDYGLEPGDVRWIDGLLLPHRFTPVGDSTRVSVIRAVRVNVELDPARFVFPPGIG